MIVFYDLDFQWSHKLQEKLSSVFHIKELRPFQLPTINATMGGHDCILIMPTGGGKSLCFQLPALLTKGVTLVVSPLISLMEDQVMSLKALGVDARMISSGTPAKEQTEILKVLFPTFSHQSSFTFEPICSDSVLVKGWVCLV